MGVSAASRVALLVLHSAPQPLRPPSVITGRGIAKPLPCLTCPAKAKNVCKPLEYDRQKELFQLGHQSKWEPRQFLFRAGSPAGPLFKIISGIVAVSKGLPDGRRQIIALVFPGDICGYTQINDHYVYDGEAIGPVTACAFDRSRFNAFIHRNPDVADAMAALLQEKLERVRQHLTIVGQLTSTERLASFLSMLARAYSEHGFQVQPLVMPMKRSDVSEYLGLRTETISRAFTKLRKQRLIELDDDDSIIICDPIRLSRLGNAVD